MASMISSAANAGASIAAKKTAAQMILAKFMPAPLRFVPSKLSKLPGRLRGRHQPAAPRSKRRVGAHKIGAPRQWIGIVSTNSAQETERKRARHRIIVIKRVEQVLHRHRPAEPVDNAAQPHVDDRMRRD